MIDESSIFRGSDKVHFRSLRGKPSVRHMALLLEDEQMNPLFSSGYPRIAFGAQSAHDSVMSEDETGKIKDELKVLRLKIALLRGIT